MTEDSADLSPEVIDEAARAGFNTWHPGWPTGGWPDTTEAYREGWRSVARAVASVLAAPSGVAPVGKVSISRELLAVFVDDSECWFDHHGDCQGHGFSGIEPGERCPQVEIKELLAAQPPPTTTPEEADNA